MDQFEPGEKFTALVIKGYDLMFRWSVFYKTINTAEDEFLAEYMKAVNEIQQGINRKESLSDQIFSMLIYTNGTPEIRPQTDLEVTSLGAFLYIELFGQELTGKLSPDLGQYLKNSLEYLRKIQVQHYPLNDMQEDFIKDLVAGRVENPRQTNGK